MQHIDQKDYQILDFISRQLELRGYPPTVREICEAVNLNSTASVHSRLRKLRNMGYIAKEDSKNRSMRLIGYPPKKGETAQNMADNSDKYLEVPIYGKVAAGIPITAVQEEDCETFPLPMDFAKNKDLFMLRVTGESMIDAAILDGDYIIVRQQPTAMNGDIVVALVNGGEATVKTFYKEKGHFRLQPENETMEPIIVDEVSIIGKVVGVFRKM